MPFLSLFLLRESTSVNVATFHAYAGFSPSYEFGSRVMRGHAARLHGRIAVSAAARHFIDRFFPGDYKVIPNGVDIARFANAVPIARWQDGTPNLLFVGRHEPRKGLLDLLKAQRILRRTGYDTRLLVVGTGPQEREARRYVATRGPPGRRIPGARQRRREGPAVPDGRRLRVPGDRRRIVRDRAARGDGRRDARSSARTSTATRASSGAAARACWSRRASPRSSRRPSRALLDDPELASAMGAAGRLRAEEFSWPRVTAKVEEYYGFVIRRLAAGGQLPVRVPRADPSGAAASARGCRRLARAGRRRAAAASDSRQTEAE